MPRPNSRDPDTDPRAFLGDELARARLTAGFTSQQDARRELPFVYTGSAAASGGGLGMLFAPVGEAGLARRLAVAGAAAELVASS